MSFVNLVKKRYTQTMNNLTSGVQIVVLYIQVNKELTLEELCVVSLKSSFLEEAGEPGEISKACPNIHELDISETNIVDWKEIMSIASQLPALEFLDISRLRISPDTILEATSEFSSLKCLVIGRCSIPPEKLHLVSQVFPGIVSLEFRGSALDFNETFGDNSFGKIFKLNLAYCKLKSFQEFQALAEYQNLTELKLCNNPIQRISYCGGFGKLRKINLEGSLINDLASVYLLNEFPMLTEIRLGNTPLLGRLKEHSRKVLVSYLSKATKVNGGYVDAKERSHHERQFIRDFSDPSNSADHTNSNEYLSNLIGFCLEPEEVESNTKVFQALVKLHGTVYKFPEISLAPPTTAKLTFECEDGRKEEREVPLGWKVSNLKLLSADLFGIPVNKQRLYYIDYGVNFGPELLRFDNKLLRAMRFKDNDIVRVLVKD